MLSLRSLFYNLCLVCSTKICRWETQGMSSSAVVVVVGDERDVCSAQPPWLVDALFTARKFRKIDLNPKIKRVVLSHCDICVMCENTDVSSPKKRFIFCDKRNSETMWSNPAHLTIEFTIISSSWFFEVPPLEKQADSPCLLSPRLLSGC